VGVCGAVVGEMVQVIFGTVRVGGISVGVIEVSEAEDVGVALMVRSSITT
jgi:hypothetical protein